MSTINFDVNNCVRYYYIFVIIRCYVLSEKYVIICHLKELRNKLHFEFNVPS